MSPATIRPATPADVDAIRRVAERGWRVAYDDVLSTSTIEAALDEWYDPDALRESLDRGVTLVATRDGRVVGYVRGGVREDGAAELGAIYVHPDVWRDGVGTALLDAFEARVAEMGADGVRLHALAGNDRGRAFYADRGYERVAAQGTDLFGETVCDLLLERPI